MAEGSCDALGIEDGMLLGMSLGEEDGPADIEGCNHAAQITVYTNTREMRKRKKALN